MKHKNRQKKNTIGIVTIKNTFNNTIITLTDMVGNTIYWSSAGTCGFKGTRKSTPFAAQSAAKKVALKALEEGIKVIEVLLKGNGTGREPSIRMLARIGLKISSIKDRTGIAHNGCRSPKKRRL